MKSFPPLEFRKSPRTFYGAFALVGVVATWAWAQKRPAKPAPKMVPIIADYREWTLVNDTPAPMDEATAQLCIMVPQNPAKPDLSQTVVVGSGGPHAKKWINVFVNDTGKAAMLTDKKPRFPIGTVIVKEKLATPKGKVSTPTKTAPDQKPELLTIMIKRERGYDKTNGDWEYMVTDGPGRKIAGRGKMARCQSCHQPYKSTDYVVRSYLPASVMAALRDSDAASVAKK